MSTTPADPYLMLTPAGALLAFADRTPDATSARLQTLVPRGSALRRSVWLGEDAERQALLEEGLKRGWLHEIGRGAGPGRGAGRLSSARDRRPVRLAHGGAGFG